MNTEIKQTIETRFVRETEIINKSVIKDDEGQELDSAIQLEEIKLYFSRLKRYCSIN